MILRFTLGEYSFSRGIDFIQHHLSTRTWLYKYDHIKDDRPESSLYY